MPVDPNSYEDWWHMGHLTNLCLMEEWIKYRNGILIKSGHKFLMNYQISTFLERFDLFEKQDKICTEVWPEFMLHDPVAGKYWGQFISAFKNLQLLIMDGEEILAILNTVPIYFEGSLKELPDEGWDWSTEKSIKDYKAGIKSNFLVGLQIVINKNYQGKGFSSIAVKEMAELARRNGFKNLIIPVRPSSVRSSCNMLKLLICEK